MGIKVTRLYTGHDGESHFEDTELPLVYKSAGIQDLEPIKATEIIFREVDGNLHMDWHNAPRRQFIIVLEGGLEIEIGSGTKRRFCFGDILLAEDTTGKGHITRSVKNQPRKLIIVPLA